MHIYNSLNKLMNKMIMCVYFSPKEQDAGVFLASLFSSSRRPNLPPNAQKCDVASGDIQTSR